MRTVNHASLAVLLWSAFLVPGPALGQVDVLTHRYDNARSGVNLNETELRKSNVTNRTFGKLAFRIVDGNIYAQPLIVTRAKVVNRAAPANLVIVATEHNSVYAFDADDTSPDAPGQESQKALWHRGPQGPHGLGPSIETVDLSQQIGGGDCVDLTTEVGITGTPAIKLTKTTAPKEGAVFVAAKSKIGAQVVYRLFALDLATGVPLGPPVAIAAQIQTPAGTRTFNPLLQLNRPALLLDQNVLYVAFGGHCDRGDYRGWVFAYDVSNPGAPQTLDALATTFRARGPGANDKEGRGGIWMSGHGPASDGTHVYFVTGDGTYNVANPAALELGNSVVKVKVAGGRIEVQDWFSPQNRDLLQKLDADLGSGGAVLLPNSHLLLAGGKEGRMYLIDRRDMGRGAKMSLQSFQVTNAPVNKVANPQNPGDVLFWNLHGSPVVWPQSPHMFVYVMGEEDRLKQYKLVPAPEPAGWRVESAVPFKGSKESAPLPNPPHGIPNDPTRAMIWMPGGFLTLSANRSDPGSGIVWATMPFAEDANHHVVRGVLRAFDASDVSKGQLWSSEDSGVPADRLGYFAKNNPPVVANGKVYVAAFQQERIDNNVHKKAEGGDQPALVIYGLK